MVCKANISTHQVDGQSWTITAISAIEEKRSLEKHHGASRQLHPIVKSLLKLGRPLTFDSRRACLMVFSSDVISNISGDCRKKKVWLHMVRWSKKVRYKQQQFCAVICMNLTACKLRFHDWHAIRLESRDYQVTHLANSWHWYRLSWRCHMRLEIDIGIKIFLNEHLREQIDETGFFAIDDILGFHFRFHLHFYFHLSDGRNLLRRNLVRINSTRSLQMVQVQQKVTYGIR